MWSLTAMAFLCLHPRRQARGSEQTFSRGVTGSGAARGPTLVLRTKERTLIYKSDPMRRNGRIYLWENDAWSPHASHDWPKLTCALNMPCILYYSYGAHVQPFTGKLTLIWSQYSLLDSKMKLAYSSTVLPDSSPIFR